MKLLRKFNFLSFITITTATLLIPSFAYAATSPGLGAANAFVVLSGTYSNSTSGTTLNGSLGYTVPPATNPTVNGATHVADNVYNQAGIDQGNALKNLNNQPCTFTFPPGAIDLSTDTTHGPVAVYTPGVYCVTGASNAVVGGTIMLTGVGTYIFRMDGALTTGANSIVTLAGGASACDVWWTPTAATTLGANSTFLGTNIDASGIAIGNNVNWTGQALAFGGTVSTDSDTISTATCTAARNNTPVVPPVVVATGGGKTGVKNTAPSLPNTGENTATFTILASLLILTGTAGIVIKRYRARFV